MHKLSVGVLRGGPSNEYEPSLVTGGAVLSHLNEEKYTPLDILITRDGQWHMRGKPIESARVLSQIDVIFNALHGEYGEDGQVQRLLERFNVPFTGADSLSAAFSMNKALTKRHLKARLEQEGFKTPYHRVLDRDTFDDSHLFDLFRSFSNPCIIKPARCGSSVGVTLSRNYEQFGEGIRHALSYSPQIILEEYIRGREATCGVVERFRGEEVYALFPVEIIPPKKSGFFSADVKYTGETEEICPGRFTQEENAKLARLTKLIHREIGLRHYSRSDFIVSPRGIYFLEVNSLPGLTPESLLPKAVSAVGCRFSDFIDHLITLALVRH